MKLSFVWLFCLWAGMPSLSANIIVTQPDNKTICKGETATFSVKTTGNQADYTYQWYVKQSNGTWRMIPTIDAKGPDYTTPTAATYRCVVTEKNTPTSQETSLEVGLTVHDVPYIAGIVVPEVCTGSTLVASANQVNRNGSDLSEYKWILGEEVVASGLVSGNTVPNLNLSVDITQSSHLLKVEITNGCGTTASSAVPIIVRPTPPNPTPVDVTLCKGDNIEPMRITDSGTPVWYSSETGGSVIRTPVPNTSKEGTQTWWVSQKVEYENGLLCESGRAPASATVRPLSAIPDFTPVTSLCLGEPSITLQATGTNLKWFDYRKNRLPAAPQINTSTAGTQTYYVTQTNEGECESPIGNGKITIRINDRANVDVVNLSYDSQLCPNCATEIVATSKEANSTFRWYAYSNKTELIQTGSRFKTPVLKRDTAYYVSVQYASYCESAYAQIASITVADNELPKITAPKNVEVSTNDGVCYATNVETSIPMVSDSCTLVSNLLVYTDPVAPTIYALGDTTLVWWAQDEGGNKDYALQTISVRDREKPRGTCLSDMIVEVDDDQDSAVVHYKLDFIDNCGPVKNVLIEGRASGTYFKMGTTSVKYEIVDSVGNTETCGFNITVQHPHRNMEVTLRPRAYKICPGEEVIITPVVSGGSGTYVYSWKQPVRTGAVMRDYPLTSTDYELTVNDGAATQTKSVRVEVLEIQQVSLTLEGRPMDEIFEGDEVLVSASSGFASYKLMLDNKVVQMSGLNNLVSFQADTLGTYYVRVFATDNNFCVSQDQLQIDVDSRKLPNVFTPNQDGKNDIFLNGFDLQVFSRAGELLYNGSNGWDGTYKGKRLPQGTYLYMVKRIMNNGELRIFKGTVTLKL